MITPQFYGVARPGHLRPRGEHNKKEHGGERIYLGYREHSLTVCLLASQARNRWIVTMTKKRRYCQRGVSQKKLSGRPYLNSEPISAVLASPILALVREPIIGCRVDPLTLVPLEQFVHLRNPHRAADNLADARHEQVAALRESGGGGGGLVTSAVTGCFLHVKGLEPGGEAVQEDGRADGVGHLSLGRLCDVVADRVRHHLGLSFGVRDHVALRVFGLVLDPVFVQPRDSVDVGEALEWARGRREGGVELLDQRRGGLVLPELVHDFTYLFVWTSMRSGPAGCFLGGGGANWGTELTTASMWFIRSSNVMNASSASRCVYSLRCRRV